MARAKKTEAPRARKPETTRVVLALGDDVSTDAIYPGRYMATVLPSETPAFAFADHPGFQSLVKSRAVPKGGVIAAGENFGCGSSREQAASCLKGFELIVVARSFARIFLQNAINLGLKVVIAPGFVADEGDEVELDGRTMRNHTKRRDYDVAELPRARQAILDAGGLIPYTRARLVAERGAPER